MIDQVTLEGSLALGFETWGVSTLRCPTARAGSTFNDIPHKFEAGASSHVPWRTREKERGRGPEPAARRLVPRPSQRLWLWERPASSLAQPAEALGANLGSSQGLLNRTAVSNPCEG